MSSSQKPAPKQTSRWGFLSQAVASVESRLDTILADDEVPSRKPTPQPVAPKDNASPSRASAELARGNNATNDRLQERLARAMAKKNHNKIDSPALSEPVSRASTPGLTSPPVTISNVTESNDDLAENGSEPVAHLSQDKEGVVNQEESQQSIDTSDSFEASVVQENSQRLSNDNTRDNQDIVTVHTFGDDASSAVLHPQVGHQDVKASMQDEINGYIERIDALNAKLQYLAKEAAETAKKSAIEAETGSTERKILEKDEKIALLMQEGQKLSMAEMKHLATIRQLRTQVSTSNKDQNASKQRAERAERTLEETDSRIKRAEAFSKSTEAKYLEASKKAQDLEAVSREKNALNDTLVDMRAQVARANARAENAEKEIRTEQVEMEKKRVQELQDDISSAKVERELAEERLRQEIRDLKAALDREKDQSRAMETEMLAEQVTLESKLESFRVRAEEASANDQGDAQAKLLRQIETLQSQYSAASQNWQGIEGTLVARISALEKERDELSTREIDLRRKLKDAVSKAKTNEKRFDEVELQYATLQETQSEAQVETQRLTRKNQQLEADLARGQKDTEELKANMERDFARRLDEEKSRWAASIKLVRTASPSASVRKSSNYDTNHLASPQLERPVSRRSSTFASAFMQTDSYPSSRHHSTTSSKHLYNGIMPETPILVTSSEPDEYFTGVPATPISPDHTASRRGVGDLISTSTVGAGPSVQLVERMSANVRRLESEKEASKDELARLSIQRDESRQEVVRLMREVEQKRSTEQRLKKLEQEYKALDDRYQTTLELLGEKSEQVEELKADVLDVKQMYRQLADHMKV